MKIPYVENDAFFENKATTILDPLVGPFNDHCFVFDNEKWHFITSKARHAVGSKSILDKMDLVDPFPNLVDFVKSNEMWAPCSVVKDSVVYIFFARPNKNWIEDWKNFADYISNGGLFTLMLAQAPLNKISDLKIVGELFDDDGGARDPFVFYHKKLNKWVMFYAKRIYENKEKIEGGIAYRVSDDLINWSKFQGYVIRDLFYEDIEKDYVTAAIGNVESPQLIEYENNFYLFATQVGNGQYHRTKIWVSDNPLHFSSPEPITIIYAHAPETVFQDGISYISNCGQHQKEFKETGNGLRAPGVEIAKLLWKDK